MDLTPTRIQLRNSQKKVLRMLSQTTCLDWWLNFRLTLSSSWDISWRAVNVYLPFECLWYADIVNYLVTEQMPNSWTKKERLCFLDKAKWFFWDEVYLFKYIMIRSFDVACLTLSSGTFFHSVMTKPVMVILVKRRLLQNFTVWFYWPTLFHDAHVVNPVIVVNDREKLHDIMKCKPDLSCQNIWCLGHRLLGTILYVSWI